MSHPHAIIILGTGALSTARRIQALYPGAQVYGLNERVTADVGYSEFAPQLRELYQNNRPIIALCAAGIVIRCLAPLLQSKGAEPPVLAVAEDGSAVVPLLGGLAGVRNCRRAGGATRHHHQWRTALRHLRTQPAERLCIGRY